MVVSTLSASFRSGLFYRSQRIAAAATPIIAEPPVDRQNDSVSPGKIPGLFTMLIRHPRAIGTSTRRIRPRRVRSGCACSALTGIVAGV